MDTPTQPETPTPAPEAVETPHSPPEGTETPNMPQAPETGPVEPSEPPEELPVEPGPEPDPAPGRDWVAELEAATAEREEAQGRAGELAEQNAALRERLLALTIENVTRQENRILHDSVLAMLDKSRLVDGDGMPDREVITAMVRQFGKEPVRFGKSASELGIGAHGMNRAESSPAQGFSTRSPYGNGRESSHKLDARNR